MQLVADWHLALLLGRVVELGDIIEWAEEKHEVTWQSNGIVWLSREVMSETTTNNR